LGGPRRYTARLEWAAGGSIRAGRVVANADTDQVMPKLKTKSGAKKRFGRTGTGKIKVAHAYKRHRLISKDKQAKRKARGTQILEKGDSKLVLTYMPYLRG
jgi:large subunit ribosomal protein L35